MPRASQGVNSTFCLREDLNRFWKAETEKAKNLVGVPAQNDIRPLCNSSPQTSPTHSSRSAHSRNQSLDKSSLKGRRSAQRVIRSRSHNASLSKRRRAEKSKDRNQSSDASSSKRRRAEKTKKRNQSSDTSLSKDRCAARRRSRSHSRNSSATRWKPGTRGRSHSKSIVSRSSNDSDAELKQNKGEPSDSSFDSLRSASLRTRAARKKPTFGVLYWGGGPRARGRAGQGWDFTGHGDGGFPHICRQSNALVDSWRGRMDNAHVTLRMCACEGTGFKRYVKHFMMLSSRACAEFRLRQFHRFTMNNAKNRKVLTERVVIGGILEAFSGRLSTDCGIRVNNETGSGTRYLQRRARRYRLQARREGGHFVAVILESGGHQLEFRDMVDGRKLSRGTPVNIKRLLVVLGGPGGIPRDDRDRIRHVLEDYTDFPLLGVGLPGGMLHSTYALASVLVFHDHSVLLPFLERHLEACRAAHT